MKSARFFIIALALLAFGCAGQLPIGPVALRSPLALVVNNNDKLTPAISFTDFRPVGIWHLSDPTRITADNSAGWLDGPNGADAFLARAIGVTKEIGAGSVIIWDIEGSTFNGNDGHGRPRMYLGSPDLAVRINPQFNADSFFAKIRAVGLVPGVCLRPTEFNLVTGNHDDSPDVYATLLRKAKFARQQWKVRLFYVDSNVRPFVPSGHNRYIESPLIPATIFARLNKALPDCRFFPEHKNVEYHLWTAPYRELRGGELDAPADMLADIPAAVSLLNVSEGDIPGNIDRLVSAIRGKRIIPAIDTFWRNPQIDDFKAMMSAAAQSPALANRAK